MSTLQCQIIIQIVYNTLRVSNVANVQYTNMYMYVLELNNDISMGKTLLVG